MSTLKTIWKKQALQIFTVFIDRLCLCIDISPNEKLIMEEYKNTEPNQPVEITPKEITTSDESAMPEAEAAAIHQPQTSTTNPKLRKKWKYISTATYTNKRNGKNIFSVA